LGPKERREREREEIRGRILDAARELFVAEGVESVTMRRIAEKIEYSATAIYFHFRDKEALLAELCDCDFRAFASGFQTIAKIADPVERLRAAGRGYIAFGMENPSHYRLMFMTPKDHSKTSSLTKGNPEEDAYAFLKGIVAELVAKRQLRPELSDVDLASQVIWSGVHGVVALEIAKCNDDWVAWQPFQARANAMVEMILRGVLADTPHSVKTPARIASRKSAPAGAAKKRK
jgi:AcrR family transcriptional regulator